ncbi:unnamed protein product [Ceratitis capitata]|uniref:(Mediterranean fruit fly) hypothetical protein n=1 Tax=Ceratitis capitata TaxID=7213 RepID=A0A811U623_CERCA|nr:unnamed protein product [Ceratitis capitata]
MSLLLLPLLAFPELINVSTELYGVFCLNNLHQQLQKQRHAIAETQPEATTTHKRLQQQQMAASVFSVLGNLTAGATTSLSVPPQDDMLPQNDAAAMWCSGGGKYHLEAIAGC